MHNFSYHSTISIRWRRENGGIIRLEQDCVDYNWKKFMKEYWRLLWQRLLQRRPRRSCSAALIVAFINKIGLSLVVIWYSKACYEFEPYFIFHYDYSVIFIINNWSYENSSINNDRWFRPECDETKHITQASSMSVCMHTVVHVSGLFMWANCPQWTSE